jgi:hypothetical protein
MSGPKMYNEYVIITALDARSLQEAVNEKLQEYFTPVGGPIYQEGVGFHQAMWDGAWPIVKT